MPVFVDTNVFVYARDGSEPAKQRAAHAWVEKLWRTREGRTGIQVLEEYYVTVTRKLRPGLSAEEARRDVNDLFAWRPVPVDPPLLERAWEVQDRFGLAFWDALLVAAAGEASCDLLLSEDLQDGQNLDGIRVMNPFTHPA